ncbi:MAG: hypothetical protein ACRDSP_20640 [Pseudonocardiaceae bacterium]
MSKEQRRLYTCLQCNGVGIVMTWKRAQLDDHPEVQEIQTMEDCSICDGAGQLLGSPT